MWEFQRYIIEALFKYRRVAVSASRSVSKTHTLGHLMPAFMYTERSRVIVVGPSMRQILKGVMSEARGVMAKSATPLMTESGTTSASEIRIDERHWAIALPARNPDAMRGFHASPMVPGDPDADYLSPEDIEWFASQGGEESTRVLIIIDEAPGVDTEAFRVLRGMMTKPNVYVIYSGNPTLGADDDHDFVRAFKDGSPFHRIRVSSLPVADFPAPAGIEYDKIFEHVPNYLVDKEEIENALREYSKDDPILISDWAGTFPSGSSVFNVVPRSALEAAVASRYRKIQPIGPRIGIDIGTGKPDPCVASLFWDGVKVIDYSFQPEADDESGQVWIADKIMALATQWGAQLADMPHPAGDRGLGLSRWSGEPLPGSRISVDDSGLVGVCDILGSRGFFVDRVNFGRAAQGQWPELVGRQRFINVRTEMHWVARRGLQEGVFVIPTRFSASWREATWTHFERIHDKHGPIIKLEPKDKVKARNKGQSPDTWDADILAMRNTDPGALMTSMGAPIQTPAAQMGRRKKRRGLQGGRKI